MSVKITTLSTSTLISTHGSTRYIVFKIKGEADGANTPRVPLNLSLVLDRSGSMAGQNKLELVKKAAAFVIDRLIEQDRVSLVAFDDEIIVAGPSCPATPTNRKVLKAELQKLKPGGSTDLGEGWFKGIEEVAEFQSERVSINQVWLFTDGQANQGITDPEELATHAGQIRKRGIITTTFGFGDDTNEDLLEAIGEKGGGRFQHIQEVGNISQAFAGELQERLHTVGRELALQINLPAGIELENLNDFEMSKGSGHVIIRLGDIFAGEKKLVVIKLRVSAGTTGQVLRPEAILMFTDPMTGTGREVQPEQEITLTYASAGKVSGERLEPESAGIVGRMLVERARKEILEANRRQEFGKVPVILEKLRGRLNRFHLLNAPGVAALLNELEQQGQQAELEVLDVSVRKSMHYQAYTAQKSRRDYNKEAPIED
jgi:Ca-activated chloride channel family protein